MKKLQHFAFAFGVVLFATNFSAPVLAQSSNLDFGGGNSIRVTPNGTTFGMNGNTVNIGNSGGRISGSGGSFSWGNGTQNSSMGRTYDLDPAYPSHGMRYVQPPPGAFGEGAGGNQFNSSGTNGVMGRSSRRESGNLAQQDNSFQDYMGDTDGKQTPMSRGGLPETTTAIQSFDNIYGMTRIPSGQFRYGFSNQGGALLRSPTGFGNQGFGGFLPQTSTGSLDINTVDR
jgi:hypothetical protein